jgi:periplasmic protein TonB
MKKNIMETKSNHNLEKTKLSNMMVGISIFAGLTLAVFSYRTSLDTGIDVKTPKYYSELTYEEVEIPKEIPINIPKTEETQPQQEIDLNQEIKTIDNTNKEQKEIVIETISIVEEEPIVIDIVEPVVDFPDVEAQFPGGEENMRKWMQENINYPEISMENGDQGRVYLKFVVERDGTITNVEVIKGTTRDLDNEAKRIVRNMPKWNPGEYSGNKVRSSFTLPINFELQ